MASSLVLRANFPIRGQTPGSNMRAPGCIVDYKAHAVLDVSCAFLTVMFPRRGLLAGFAGGAISYLSGMPAYTAAVIGVVTFLGLGGWRYSRLVVRTLPRDLRFCLRLIPTIHNMTKNIKSKTTIADLFVHTVNRHPDKTAVVYVNEDRKWTFRELNEYTNRVANHFRSLGLKRGDVVALFVENSLEFLGLFLGLAKIGVTSAFINSNLRQEALAHCIRISDASAIVFTASLSETVRAVLDPTLSDMCYSVAGESDLPQAKCLDRELEAASTQEPSPPANKECSDVLCYIYTSGTTGLPKACIVKDYSYFWVASGWKKVIGISEEDLVYCTLPLYHSNGGILGSGQMILGGCTLVLRKKFSASNFWTDCINHQCTVVFYIGELCRYLLAQPSRPTDTRHRVKMAIGNGLRPQIWQSFQNRFQVGLIKEFYGTTEGNVGGVNTVGKVGACRFVSIVLPFITPLTLIKVDPDTGEHIRDSNGYCIRAGINEPGEAVGPIRKHSEFAGYTSKEASSKKIARNVFKPNDEYYLSGDILRMDEEGFLYFCDRIGDTFRWKGENVSTAEVEAIIAGILELRDVVVYGVEVPGMEGRAGMAAIVGNTETVNLSNLAKQLPLSLPNYAVPVFVRLVKQVELTSTFKLQKVQLRKEGYDLNKTSDPLYFLDPTQKVYVPLTSTVYQQLVDGAYRM